MKLAVFTDEVSQELDRAIRLAVEYKLDGVELRSVWGTGVQKLSRNQVKRAREALEAHDLKVAAIASPVFKCELGNAQEHRDHLDYLRHCIEVGRELGTNIIRLFAFWKRGPSDPVWEQIKREFSPAIPIAEGEGAVLGIENEASTYLATAAEVKRFLSEIDSPVVKAVWDPCNEIFAEDGILPYPDAYELVKPWVVHVHIKDAKRDSATGEPAVTPLGEGVIDWRGQLESLLREGYQGYASLETHWRPHALSEDQLNRPGGEAFSEAGEYASDLCLKNLMGILADARRAANQHR